MKDPVFHLVEDADQLLALSYTITEDFPHSTAFHNALVFHGRGYTSKYNFYTLKAHPSSHVMLWKSEDGKGDIGLNCPDTEIVLLMEALTATQVLDWTKDMCFYHVSNYLLEPLQALCMKMTDRGLGFGPCFAYSYKSCNKDPPLRCKAGLRLRRLGEAGVKRLHEAWKYNHDSDSTQFLELSKHVPFLGVYLDPLLKEDYDVSVDDIPYAADDQVPVSWMGTSHSGSLGQLMTEEGHRRQGLGGLVTQGCARMQVHQGLTPVAHVDTRNAPSKAMFEGLPGWRYSHDVSFVFYTANKS